MAQGKCFRDMKCVVYVSEVKGFMPSPVELGMHDVTKSDLN